MRGLIPVAKAALLVCGVVALGACQTYGGERYGDRRDRYDRSDRRDGYRTSYDRRHDGWHDRNVDDRGRRHDRWHDRNDRWDGRNDRWDGRRNWSDGYRSHHERW